MDSAPPSSVLAHTTATSAMAPLVIHALAPLSTHVSPSFTARVRMPPGLDPKSGSVRPKHPMRRPWAMPGSNRSFCSSLP
ncbi:transcription factor Tcf4 variant S9 [Stigmatella aurantiaca DW4/3-1]|uniref:Transcription factor Tcf4 variant S9 n=1 Tax=Stigmatella aurantiaca (strain DW4/3-1) TaxID=378806 RepID=Q08TG4_STIAD|nr:transcription factor Tcf4 variant S9 [Stigmatella aurantiaca DW4/3-1]